MNIQVEPLKRCQLVKLSGRIDSASAPELEESLLNFLDAGARNLAINVRDVEFISSAGLTALMRARIRARKKLPSGEVVISEIPPDLRDTFELVGLQHLFQFYDTDAAATGSF
jgi:anti-sigma B factor antagonist